MRRIFVYIIISAGMMAFQSSWLLMAQTNDKAKSKSTPPDTVAIPLKIRVAIDIADPVIYALDRENKTFEGFLSADLNEKRSVYLNGGYSTCSISQNGYRYLAKGIFFKAGIDFNILKPQTAMGKFWGGIGFHYGVSPFTDQIPLLSQDNYWGSSSMSVPTKSHWGHYLEISPGFRAELFSGFAIGWSVSLRRLIYAGPGKDLSPIFIPGYGTSSSMYSTGLNYYLIWNIPYKKINVVIKKPKPEEPEEENKPENPGTIHENSQQLGGQ